MYRYELHGALGTVVDLRVGADSEPAADAIETLVQAELARLETVFSVFDDSSDLSRWRCGAVDDAPDELVALLANALDWQARSDGLFNPLVGELVDKWIAAERVGSVPDTAELAAAATAISRPRYAMVDGRPVRGGDCSALSLNAIAKGYIVDLVCRKALTAGCSSISLNVGGDTVHAGHGSLTVGIENPLRPYDNEPPVAVVELARAAIATSGATRRGFRIAGEWFGHVLDPRTGWPASGPASVSVVAANAMTADVVATVGTILDPAEALDWISGLDDVGGLVIDHDGSVLVTPGWTARFG